MNAKDAMKAVARDALRLLPAWPPRDDLLQAIEEDRRAPRRVAHVTRLASTSRDDEEWSQSTRFVELTYEFGVLVFNSYYNYASVVGASQDYDCQLRSDQPFNAESEAKLRKWLKEWRELLDLGEESRNASIY